MQVQRAKVRKHSRVAAVAVAKLYQLQCLRMGDKYLDIDKKTSELRTTKDQPETGLFSITSHNYMLRYGNEHTVLTSDLQQVFVELFENNSRCRLYNINNEYMNQSLWFGVPTEQAAVCDVLLPPPDESSEEDEKVATPPPPAKKTKAAKKQKKATKPVGRMAKEAKECLHDKMEEMEFKLLKNARLLAGHSGRKTITKADMEQAARLCRF